MAFATASSRKKEYLLPANLQKILLEVARNGGCSRLSWFNHSSSEGEYPRDKTFSQDRRGNAKRKRSAATATATKKSLRTPGSASEDGSAQYECDSEGTSTTTNSESSEQNKKRALQLGHDAAHTQLQLLQEKKQAASSNSTKDTFLSLSQAFASALVTVLDHSYRTLGGYKLSPAEQRSMQRSLAPRDVFRQRRERLVELVVNQPPPFTIQRLAEVLLSPDRYYRQTHKLCNCLEKLLLVRCSIHAFGGSIGGQTAQSRREERELIALADERERQESEQRNRRLRRRGDVYEEQQHQHDEVAKLRHKFDHTHDARSMTTSPPPPLHSFVRHLDPSEQGSTTEASMGAVVARAPSPILFSSNTTMESTSPRGAASNVHLLQLHLPGMTTSPSPLDIVIEPLSCMPTYAAANTNKEAEADIEPDRSSASNSDIDSESDFSDSDRSDGSDYEPFSAARVIALNRVQRLRVLGGLHAADAEYQSSDSIDSTLADDSGGSDSSLSDLAD